MKYSICIAARGPTLGLWATIHACEASIRETHEYCVCVNGREMDEPLILLSEHIKLVHVPEALPPPIARGKAAELASGHRLIFFDDHVIPHGEFFRKLEAMQADVLHTSYQTYIGGPRYYGYRWLNLDTMHGDYSPVPFDENPYPIMAGNMNGLIVLHSVFDAVGGFGDFWKGFGGEEAYFDLKCWAAGYEVWLNPAMLSYHFSVRDAVRGYDKTFEEPNFAEAAKRIRPEVAKILRIWGNCGVRYQKDRT